MQQFIKMRKQVSMTESTRLVLNKSIDLLHKLSNGKLGKEEAKKELSVLLSTYFVTVYPEGDRGVDAEKKLRLKHILDQAYQIVDQVDLGKVPLYEAIMLMNKIVVSLKASEQPESSEKRISIDHEVENRWTSFVAEERAQEAREEVERVDLKEESPLDRKSDRETVRFRPVVEDFEGGQDTMKKSVPLSESYETKKVEKTGLYNEEIAELMNDVLKQRKALQDSVSRLNQALHTIGFEIRPLSDRSS